MTAKRPSGPSPSRHAQAARHGPGEQPPGRYAEEEPPSGRVGACDAVCVGPRADDSANAPSGEKADAASPRTHPQTTDPPSRGAAQFPPPLVWAGRPLALIVTCEHAGNRVPDDLLPLFHGQEELLTSHLGYDAGALDLALALGRAFAAPVLPVDVTRLVVDANRSPGRRGLFSSFTKVLPPARKRRLLADHHAPHRRKVDEAVAANVAGGLATLHVAAHSFTPVLDGRVRRADAGLLYDPARHGELALCAAWQQALRALAPGLAVLRNSPYRGRSDGLPTWLRRRHPAEAYMGVEVELNQKHLADATAWKALIDALVQALGGIVRAQGR